MEAQNLVQWLAQGPLPLFAIFVGFIVALDVFVVEFTRDYEAVYRDGRPQGLTNRMIQMALTHAAMHAVSFLLYMGFIAAGQGFTFFSIEFLNIPAGVGWGFLNLLNFLIVIFIWWTYRNKIKEDHSAKIDAESAIDRSDMRLLVSVLQALAAKFGLGQGIRGLAIAGAVAVDMLAISALLKTFLLPTGQEPPVSQLFGSAWLDVPFFGLLIFGTVFAMVIAAQALRYLLKENVKFVFTLRIAEPIAVFYILTGSVRAFAQMQGVDTGLMVSRYGLVLDAAFALILTLSIFIANRLSYRRAYAIYQRRNADEPAGPVKTISELFEDLRQQAPFVGWSFLMFLFVLGCLWFAYSTGTATAHNHLVEATSYFAFGILVVTIGVLYLPVGGLDRREIRSNARMDALTSEQPSQFAFRLLGTTIALAALCAYSVIVFGEMFEVTAIIAWSAYIVLAWGFYDLRRWRFWRSGIADRQKEANSAELASAIGLSSSIVALASTQVVSRLAGM